jgi:hypothetical protein
MPSSRPGFAAAQALGAASGNFSGPFFSFSWDNKLKGLKVARIRLHCLKACNPTLNAGIGERRFSVCTIGFTSRVQSANVGYLIQNDAGTGALPAC